MPLYTPMPLARRIAMEGKKTMATISDKTALALRDAEFGQILSDAFAKGQEAGRTASPRAMAIVACDLFGTPTPGAPVHVEDEGACGFAWVNIKPGNSSFAQYLKKQGIADKSYYGGVDIWISEHGQSYERKLAHARAISDHFRDNVQGVTVHASGRLD